MQARSLQEIIVRLQRNCLVIISQRSPVFLQIAQGFTSDDISRGMIRLELYGLVITVNRG